MNKRILILSLILIFLFSVRTSFAKEQGISETPSIAHLDLAVDPPEYSITYENNTSADITLELSVKDFTELEDSYKLQFLTNQESANYKYSLSSWITFENKNIELSPGEKKEVKIFIDKNRITKGGHYASILAEIKQENNPKKIGVKAVLSSLLFVRAATGLEVEEGKINDFLALRDGIEYPKSYRLRFENSGNVTLSPFGVIQVYDPLGNLTAKGIINEGSLDTLPESIRNFDTTVAAYQKVLIPGLYTAKIDIRFGKTNQKISNTIKFFSQGSFDFIKIGLIITAIILTTIFYYKRRNR